VYVRVCAVIEVEKERQRKGERKRPIGMERPIEMESREQRKKEREMYTKQRMTRQDLLNTCGAVASAFLPLRLVTSVACLIVVEETPIKPGTVRVLDTIV
jgi:hypothetical protein